MGARRMRVRPPGAFYGVHPRFGAEEGGRDNARWWGRASWVRGDSEMAHQRSGRGVPVEEGAGEELGC